MNKEKVNSNRLIAKNAIFLYVRLAIVMVVSLYITRIVLQGLGVEDYGIYNVVCGFVSMFGFFGTSMTNGIQRFYNYEKEKAGDGAVVKVFSIAFIQQCAIAAILVLLLLTIGMWYLNNVMNIPDTRIESANWVFLCSISSLVLVIIQTPYSAAVISYERMNFFAVVSIIDVFAKLGIAYCIQYADVDRLVLYGFLLLSIQIINIVLYIWYCKVNFTHLKLIRYFDKSLFKSMLAFSGWNLLSSFAFMLSSQGVNILLNKFFSPVINAAHGVASQISYAVQSFSINIMLAFQPQLVQSYAENNYNRVEQLMFNMTKISYILLSIIAIPICVEIEYILELWLGSSIPDYTDTFIKLVIVVMGLGLFHTSITRVFHAIGYIKRFTIATCLIVCSILPISWLWLFFNDAPTPECVYVVTIVAYLINWIVCFPFYIEYLNLVFIDVFALEYTHKFVNHQMHMKLRRIRKFEHRYKRNRMVDAIISLRKEYAFATIKAWRFISNLLPGKQLRHTLGTWCYRKARYEEDLFPLTTVQFEGYIFPAPHDSDAYLRKIYGDYMQLPAEKEVHTLKIEFLG